MKIAIVHDELIRRGGAEQFTLIMHEAFPDAPIYTSSYNKKNTYDGFEKCDIRTSWLGYFAKNEKILKLLFFPFGIWAMRKINLSKYDVVFISTTTSAKFITTSPNTLVIAFCHFPFRLAWYPNSYTQVANSTGIMKSIYKTVIRKLKSIDFKAAQNINWFITNTNGIRDKILECYSPKNEITILPSSIRCINFYVADQPKKDFYLIVSRFEPYKKIDLAIAAFNQMPSRKLIIVGRGSEKEACIKMANSNIEFKEGLSSSEIAYLFSNCNALIFPQVEDYGLTPLEANASGRPVIAYEKGGVLDTMIPYKTDSSKATALFFQEQTSEHITAAVQKFEQLNFDSCFIRKHAEKFDEDVFINHVRQFVHDKYTISQKENKDNLYENVNVG